MLRLMQRRVVRPRHDAVDGALGEQRVGDPLHRLAERLVSRDEVRLAVQLDERASRAVGGDARDDLALGGGAARAGLAPRDALLPQPLDRLIHVALALLERLLAIHHARLSALPQLRHVLGGICCHSRHFLAWRGNAAGCAGGV